MGKVLKVLGVIFLLIIAGFVALLFWAHSEGEEQMSGFFQAVGTGQPEKVTALMTPEYAATFDPPILKMWMNAMNERLGTFQDMSSNGFNTSKNTTNGVTRTEVEGTAEFEKGDARVKMILIDEKISDLSIESKAMEENWFEKPDEEFYKARVRTFIEHLVAGRIGEAIPLLTAQLVPLVSVDETKAGMARFREEYGPLEEITFTEVLFKSGTNDGAMRFLMSCKCEKGTVPAYVDLGFSGMRGEITAFQIPGTPE